MAVSPDGLLWFDGTQWVASSLKPPSIQHVPTRWTFPLQLAVIAVSLLGVTSFVLSLWLPPQVVTVVGAMPGEQAAQMAQTTWISGAAYGTVLLGLVVLVVVGALKLWTPVFWITLVGLGLLGVVPLMEMLSAQFFAPPPPTAIEVTALSTPPPAVQFVIMLTEMLTPVACAIAFVWMLVTAIRIGPWACRKTIKESADLKPAGE